VKTKSPGRGITEDHFLSDLETGCAVTYLERPREEVTKEMTVSDYIDLIKTVRKRQEGQTMAEYAVVLGVITLAVVGVFTALAGGISGAINSVKGAI
jgi:Flp pilus assembly pilin Flp